MADSKQITQLLHEAAEGKPGAFDRVVELVYSEGCGAEGPW